MLLYFFAKPSPTTSTLPLTCEYNIFLETKYSLLLKTSKLVAESKEVNVSQLEKFFRLTLLIYAGAYFNPSGVPRYKVSFSISRELTPKLVPPCPKF